MSDDDVRVVSTTRHTRLEHFVRDFEAVFVTATAAAADSSDAGNTTSADRPIVRHCDVAGL